MANRWGISDRLGDNRGQDGRMASLTQWTWVWASLGRWWRTGKSGVLQSVGSQRLGHDWVTEQLQSNSPPTYRHKRNKTLFWHKDLYMNVHQSVCIESSYLTAPNWKLQISINWGMDKRTVIQSYNVILLSNKRKYAANIHYNMDKTVDNKRSC